MCDANFQSFQKVHCLTASTTYDVITLSGKKIEMGIKMFIRKTRQTNPKLN